MVELSKGSAFSWRCPCHDLKFYLSLHWFSRRSRLRYNGSLRVIRRSARYLHPLSLASLNELLVNNPYLTVALSLTSFVIRSVFASVPEAPCASLFRASSMSLPVPLPPYESSRSRPYVAISRQFQARTRKDCPRDRGTGTAFADDDEGDRKSVV